MSSLYLLGMSVSPSSSVLNSAHSCSRRLSGIRLKKWGTRPSVSLMSRSVSTLDETATAMVIPPTQIDVQMFATRSRAGRCADARPWRRPASWLSEPADCPRHCHTPYGLSAVVADGVALPIEEVNGRAKIKRAMARDLTVILDDRPGQLAMLGEAAGEAGVNLRGLAAFTGEGRGILHLLV